MTEQQTFANHRRFDPLNHFILMPALLITCLLTLRHWYKYPGHNTAWFVVVAFALVLMALKSRMYALKVQDRLIRLEEILRMQRLLPADLQGRIHELTPKQFVGLRFASDGELTDRVREALDQHLNNEAIKKHIQTWRPDTFRV